MSITYKNDDSFFVRIKIPGTNFGKWRLDPWLRHHSQYRYIYDYDADANFYTLQQINELYPDVKTVTMVLNPWTRMYHFYKSYTELADTNNTLATWYKSQNFAPANFEEFVLGIEAVNPPEIDWNFSFPNLLVPQSRWLEYTDASGTHTVDYILRIEHIAEDFKGLQQYFMTDSPIEPGEDITDFDYTNLYTPETEAVVTRLFAEDIERFGYKFKKL